MGTTRRGGAGLAGIMLGLGGVLHLAGGCGRRAGARSSAAPAVSPVEIRCERIAGGVPNVTLRNRTHRSLDVNLLGYAYAGRQQWEHWWTQHDIHLPPRGTWSAQVYEIRGEKLEVRDSRDRLLGQFNLMKDLPALDWDAMVALHSRVDWQPFRRLYAFGQKLGSRRWFERIAWRSITPSELPRYLDNFRPLRVRVVGDVRAEALSPGQLAALRGGVERGQILIVCGGADLARLRGWDRAGLLAVPARGARTVPGLAALAQRYGLTTQLSPLSVADVGAVRPPARALLVEHGIPLVIERPLGAGKLLFLTFDPTRPPFRGSPLEAPFWQEWARRGDDGFLGIAAIVAEGDAYHQLQRRLHMVPPTVGMLAGFWIGYMLLLLLALLLCRPRVRGLLAAVTLGSAAALALGPLLYSSHPVASLAGLLYLRSGDGRGWWRGSGSFMLPRGGVATLRVPQGGIDLWDTPTLRLPSSPYLLVQPRMRRWVTQHGEMDAAARVGGDVAFELELEGDGVYAVVRNRTPHALEEIAVIWDHLATLRLGHLPPGGQMSRRLAWVEQDGVLRGMQDRLPAVYGEATGFGNSLDTYDTPLLVAHGPAAPRPTLLADERPVSGEALTALLVAPSGFHCGGEAGTRGGTHFRLPCEAVTERLVRAGGWTLLAGPRLDRGWLVLEPQEWAVMELPLPAGAGRAAWRRIELWLDGRASQLSAFRIQAFDWQSDRWVPVATLRGLQTTRLPSPARFIHPQTDSLLLRVENVSDLQAMPSAVRPQIRGEGERR